MSYRIKKAVPMPERQRRRARYPFGRMAVGDSFGVKNRQPVTSAAYAHGKRYGRKFSIRQFDNGFRVWRVK